MSSKFNIAIMIPTRGRSTALEKSVRSVVELAAHPEKLQLLFAFDNDDTVGLPYFTDHLQPWLDSQNIEYTAVSLDRLGYRRLNVYYNELSKHANADWLMCWGDDSIIETDHWDQKVTAYNGQFKLLKVHTHNEHPYSIFPIWPREWYDMFGWVSRHQMVDAELSQMAYMLDIVEIIDMYVTHDRADLTKNNNDATQKAKIMLEGNPNSPLDFHNPAFGTARITDCEKISKYLESLGQDVTWWNNVKLGQQDPWEKLRLNDINKQMFQYTLKVQQ
jgi:hypothetical protein